MTIENLDKLNFSLFVGNNVDVLEQQFSDESIDLIVTSPPYDNLRTYNGFEFDYRKLIPILHKKLKTGGVIIWVVGDATTDGGESGTSFRQAICFQDNNFLLNDTMIYAKKSGIPTNTTYKYRQCFEYMFCFSKGLPKTFNPILIPTSEGNATRKIRTSKFRQKDGTFKTRQIKFNDNHPHGNIFEYKIGGNVSVPSKIQHPAVFPLQLAYDQIKSWSNENDLIVDPFVGSGTTGVACKILKRKFIGIDISKEYIEEAKYRIDNWQNDLNLLYIDEQERTNLNNNFLLGKNLYNN